MRRLFSLLVASALCFVQITTMTSAAGAGDDQVVGVARDDPHMVAAIRQARASLDEFLALAEAPPAGTDGFKLKVMVKDGDAVEHFWVLPFQRTADGFEGTLADDPQVVHNVMNGQNIKFTRDEISDWGYTKNGRQVGSFTVCVLFKQMPEADADYYRSNYGFDC